MSISDRYRGMLDRQAENKSILLMSTIKIILAICLVFFPLVVLADDYQVHENYVPKHGEYYRPRDDKLQKYKDYVPDPGNYLKKRGDRLQYYKNYVPKYGSHYRWNGDRWQKFENNLPVFGDYLRKR